MSVYMSVYVYLWYSHGALSSALLVPLFYSPNRPKISSGSPMPAAVSLNAFLAFSSCFWTWQNWFCEIDWLLYMLCTAGVDDFGFFWDIDTRVPANKSLQSYHDECPERNTKTPKPQDPPNTPTPEDPPNTLNPKISPTPKPQDPPNTLDPRP